MMAFQRWNTNMHFMLNDRTFVVASQFAKGRQCDQNAIDVGASLSVV